MASDFAAKQNPEMTLPESECVPNTILELLSDNDTVLTFVFFVLGWFICRLGFPDRRSAVGENRVLSKVSREAQEVRSGMRTPQVLLGQ